MTTTPQHPSGRQQDTAPTTQQPYYGPPNYGPSSIPVQYLPYGTAAPAAPRPARNGFGITALCLGIVGVLFGFIPLTFVLALILGFLALVFGLVGWSRTRKGTADNRKTSIAGTVLAVAALALGIWGATILFQATNTFVNSMNNLGVPGQGSVTAPAASGPAAGPSSAGAFPGAHTNDVVGHPGSTLTIGTMHVTTTKLRAVTSEFSGPQTCSTVTYTNTGTTQESFNALDWKLQNPNGAAVTTSFGGTDNQLNSGDLAPGGTQTGDVCFDAKTTAPGQYVLLYAPGFSSDAPRGAWLN